MSRLYWIETPTPGRLAITARPRADDWLDVEIDGWKQLGLDIVVSLLEHEEVAHLGLQREAELCLTKGIEFRAFPIPDRGVPSSIHSAAELAQSIAAGLSRGRSIAIHCRVGIGRSSLIAACALVCIGADADADGALALIKQARGLEVPDTDEQRAWVISFHSYIQSRTQIDFGRSD